MIAARRVQTVAARSRRVTAIQRARGSAFESRAYPAYVRDGNEVVGVTFVVLFAAIAAFLALRLYAALGKRTGHEQALPRPAEERAATPTMPRTLDIPAEVRESGPRAVEQGAEGGLRTLVAADPSFDVGQFVEGAKGAYRMILEAFWKGDRETLGWLVEDEVRDAFFAAIDAREAEGHVVENRLVSIERAGISNVELNGRIARVTVRFDADIAMVTRDADGNVISGSMSDAVETHDVWEFSRDLKSGDPNWKLSDTDEA
jgi:predicted lipid-binding transport protein (Tim44 family)